MIKKKRKKFQSPLLIEREGGNCRLATPRYPFIFLTTKLGNEGERLEEVFRVLRSRIKPDWIGILNAFPV